LYLLPFVVAGCLGLPKYGPDDAPMPDVEQVDSLALAAERLDRGDAAGAVPHLAAHVDRFPDHVAIRAMLADQLFAAGESKASRIEYERTADDYAGDPAKHRDELVRCHTRLMRFAQDDDDESREAYHRGAGLYYLAAGWSAKDHDQALTERTLSQALVHLKAAAATRPDDATLHVLLGDALTRLGQPAAARAAYRVAANAPPGRLSDRERRAVEKALRQ
jgi:Flp pilus assembly protein TadD